MFNCFLLFPWHTSWLHFGKNLQVFRWQQVYDECNVNVVTVPWVKEARRESSASIFIVVFRSQDCLLFDLCHECGFVAQEQLRSYSHFNTLFTVNSLALGFRATVISWSIFRIQENGKHEIKSLC